MEELVSPNATGTREGEPDANQREIRQRNLHQLEKQYKDCESGVKV